MHWLIWASCIYVSIGLIFSACVAKGPLAIRVAIYIIGSLFWFPMVFAIVVKSIRDYKGDAQ